MGGPTIEDEPRNSVRRPNAEVKLSRPQRSTRTMLVRDIYAAETDIRISNMSMLLFN